MPSGTTVQNIPARRQRRKPERFARLVRYPDGTLTLSIGQVLNKNREAIDGYTVKEIGADTGRGFRLTKPDGTVYHVKVGCEHESCECPGHLQHGHKTVCKHRASLPKLIAEGKL